MSSTKISARIGAPDLTNLGPSEKIIVEGAINKLGGPYGPRIPLLHSPAVAGAWSQLGKALRQSELKDAWREIAILVVGAFWKADFEWHAHAPRAIMAGITESQLEDIKFGRTPQFDDSSTQSIYQYCYELVRIRNISDTTYDELRKILGDRILIELTVLVGHFTNVAMTLNAHHVQLPPGIPSPFNQKIVSQRTGKDSKVWFQNKNQDILRYRFICGNGPTLVFIHELGGVLESWEACVEFLTIDNPILLVEWRGSGLSTKINKSIKFEEVVDDLLDVIKDAIGNEPVVLIGVAAGAAVAIRAASRMEKQVAALVAAVPALGTPKEQREAVQKLSERVECDGMKVMQGMERTYPNALREIAPENWLAFSRRHLGNDPVSYAHLLRMVMDVDLSDDFQKILCPTLVIGGTYDIRPIEMMRDLTKKILNAEFKEIPAGHYMSAQVPQMMAEIIQDFVCDLK